MPLYDCGAPECEECQRAFGPDRSKAIANYQARDQRYQELTRCLTPEEHAMIDAAWEKHKAAGPQPSKQ